MYQRTPTADGGGTAPVLAADRRADYDESEDAGTGSPESTAATGDADAAGAPTATGDADATGAPTATGDTTANQERDRDTGRRQTGGASALAAAIRQLAARARALASDERVEDLDADAAATALEDINRLKAATAGLEARLVAACQQAGAHEADGAKDATAWLRDRLKMSGRTAKKTNERARRMRRLPGTSQAWAPGTSPPSTPTSSSGPPGTTSSAPAARRRRLCSSTPPTRPPISSGPPSSASSRPPMTAPSPTGRSARAGDAP